MRLRIPRTVFAAATLAAAAMLAAPAAAECGRVTFSDLGWTDITGGDDWFGPDLGGAEMRTSTRAGLPRDCPNLGRFLTNLDFTLALENEIMAMILNDGMAPGAAAQTWLAAHSEAPAPWLDGVTTLEGEDGLAAVIAALP